ncbi:hypothetical protein GCM10009836_19600 [Pseudonocardia ailaonensis]|uniref:Fenitrothion hydrolase n=1 Tax=Pseudonocardia ailaonensis TaxID=367279 RepID=A0ABN2MW40_9PSEU
MTVLAHGVGTRGDLPVPVGAAALAAGLVLVGTFLVLGRLWRTPRLRGADAGRPLPEPPALLTVATRALVLVAFVAVIVIGLVGPPETPDNLAPWVLYVNVWVGIVPVSLLLGPVWRAVNPLRTLHAGLSRLLRIDPGRGVADLSPRVGLWPAAFALGAFGWLELAHPEPADPRLVAWCLIGYAVVQTGAALVFGRSWFAHGDGLEVWSTLLGSLAPVGRRRDGRLVLRNPLDGLETVHPQPGLVAVVLVLVGTTAFDGLSRSALWTVPRGITWGTVGLLGVTAVVVVLYLAGTWRADPVRGVDRAPLPVAFAHTIIPIAAGYAIAHYFSLLVFDGQQVFRLALGTGPVDYTLVGTATIAAVQLAAIVLGHIAAAVGAHERALRLFPPSVATRIQYPMLAAMVVLTCGAVGLVLAA